MMIMHVFDCVLFDHLSKSFFVGIIVAVDIALLMEIYSTSIKSMWSKVLVSCLHSILCLFVWEMSDNPFVPFAKVCKLLRDFTFLKHETLGRVMVGNHLVHLCLFAFLEMSEKPLSPSFMRTKLLFNLLKVELWSSISCCKPSTERTVISSNLT